MIQANLQWIQQEWRNWIETDRAKKINPSREYKTGVEHVAKLFAAHCVEALRSEAEPAPAVTSEESDMTAEEARAGAKQIDKNLADLFPKVKE